MTARDDKRGVDDPSPLAMEHIANGSDAILARYLIGQLSANPRDEDYLAEVIRRIRQTTPSHALQNDATPQGDSAGESRSTLERAQGGQFAGKDAADKGKCGDSSVSRSAEHEPARVAPSIPSTTPQNTVKTEDGRNLMSELDKIALFLDSEKCGPSARIVEQAKRALNSAWIACGVASMERGEWQAEREALVSTASAIAEKWISTKDRLPDEHGPSVLVLQGGNQYVAEVRRKGKGVWIGADVYTWDTISHWMPLPEGPNNSPDGGKQTNG